MDRSLSGLLRSTPFHPGHCQLTGMNYLLVSKNGVGILSQAGESECFKPLAMIIGSGMGKLHNLSTFESF